MMAMEAALTPLPAEGLLQFRFLRADAAATVTKRFYAAHGRAYAAFGQRGREACREDLAFHLEFLLPVLEFGFARPMVDYLHWLASVLAARGIPSDHVTLSLDLLAEFFADRMDPAYAATVSAALSAACAEFLNGKEGLLPPPLPWPGAAIFEMALLAGDQRDAMTIVNRCIDGGQSLTDVELHIIQPALYHIGECWQANQISVAAEHLATAIAEAVMTMGLLRSPVPETIGKRVLLACVAGNHHAVGLRMVADAFQQAGWDTRYLGANVPGPAIVQLAVDWKADVVGLSVSFAQQLRSVKETIAGLRENSGHRAAARDRRRPCDQPLSPTCRHGGCRCLDARCAGSGCVCQSLRRRPLAAPVAWYAPELEPMLAVVAATLDEAGTLIEANVGFQRIIGAAMPKPIGCPAARFFIQPDFATLARTMGDALGEVYRGLLTIGEYTGHSRTLHARIWRIDGRLRVLAEFDIEELERLNDIVLGLNNDYANAQLELAQINLKLQRHEAQILATSFTDPLTGVGNRRRLEQALVQELSRAERTGRTLSAFMADLDHFKAVNDRYGHENGDKVLAAFGELLRRRTRESDTVARFGGEEFVVLMPETDLAGATQIAERVREAMAACRIEPLPDPVTASFGVAELAVGEPARSLLARIDKALYEAKHAGRDRVAVG